MTRKFSQEHVLQLVHASLQKVLQLVPTANSMLLQVLLTKFPHKLHEKRLHALYLENIFRLVESEVGKPLRDDVLLEVVNRLLQVDVDMRWEDIQSLELQEEEHQQRLKQAERDQKGSVVSINGDEDDDDVEALFEMEEMVQQVEAAGGAQRWTSKWRPHLGTWIAAQLSHALGG
eukprot:gene12447-14706_t